MIHPLLCNAKSNFYPRSPCGERRKYHTADRVRACISIHALLAESDVARNDSTRWTYQFLSTLSLRRATAGSARGISSRTAISIHALLAESDTVQIIVVIMHTLFLSTLSLRRATVVNNIVFVPGKFLSTLSLRRATSADYSCHNAHLISIHALLAESDREPTALRTPHHRFLSTLSLRRATSHLSMCNTPLEYFYPRSPCGERLFCVGFSSGAKAISIHALLAESDTIWAIKSRCTCGFLSTLSLRRATIRGRQQIHHGQ